MRFCIYANTDKDVGCFFTGKILDYLDAAGASWRIYEKNAQFFPGKTTGRDQSSCLTDLSPMIFSAMDFGHSEKWSNCIVNCPLPCVLDLKSVA